ncbi:MAG: hypothetical protein JXR96_20260 [Deltaproteobacteria bacterium]|nr:hypothetical protein [Deltaproteobacteria bacterium]
MVSTVTCQEQGTPRSERWSPPFLVSSEDLSFLEARSSQEQIEIERISSMEIRVAGRKYCGRIRLPSGRWLQIQSKVPPARIMDWLVYSRTIPSLESWIDAPMLDVGTDAATALAALFLHELSILTNFHLRPGYCVVSQVRRAFRGRLVERKLARESRQLPALPCAFRDRTMSTVQNCVLARALDACWRLGVQNALRDESRCQLERLNAQWAGIERTLSSVHHALTVAVACPPVGYRNALQLARMLMVGAGFDLAGGDGGDSFLVSMAGIFERALRRMAAQWARRNGWASMSSSARTRFWDDAPRKRSFIADVMVQHPSHERIILDAKYKCGYGHESREDCFQMCAYLLAFKARTALLVYPTGMGNPRTLLQSDLVPSGATILSMELPMAKGPAECEAQMRQIMNQVADDHVLGEGSMHATLQRIS